MVETHVVLFFLRVPSISILMMSVCVRLQGAPVLVPPAALTSFWGTGSTLEVKQKQKQKQTHVCSVKMITNLGFNCCV